MSGWIVVGSKQPGAPLPIPMCVSGTRAAASREPKIDPEICKKEQEGIMIARHPNAAAGLLLAVLLRVPPCAQCNYYATCRQFSFLSNPAWLLVEAKVKTKGLCAELISHIMMAACDILRTDISTVQCCHSYHSMPCSASTYLKENVQQGMEQRVEAAHEC